MTLINLAIMVGWVLVTIAMAKNIKRGTLFIMVPFQFFNLVVLGLTVYHALQGTTSDVLEILQHAVLLAALGVIAYSLTPQAKRLTCTYPGADKDTSRITTLPA